MRQLLLAARRVRRLRWTAVLVVALTAALVTGSAAVAPAGKRDKRSGAASAPKKQREIMSARTRSSKTYLREDGQRVARVYGGAVHFKNAKGRWQNIDTQLRRSDGRLLNRTTGFSSSLPSDIGRDSFRIRRGKWWVGFSVRGARGTAQAKGNLATYADALPGVDASYRLSGDALKETLLLKSPDAQRRFVFDLQMHDGLRPRVLKTKGVVLRDRRGKTRMTIAAPFTEDAKGRRHRVGLALKNVDGRWRLSLTASDAWLGKSSRAWPVALDPAVYPTGDSDCDFSSSTPTASNCSADELWAGQVGGATWNSVIRFDGLAAAIPRGADVQGASLVVEQLGAENATNTRLRARALTERFTAAASWNSNDGTDRWSEPGGEFDEGDDGEVEEETNIHSSGNGTQYMHMWKIVRDWASGKRANHGLLLSAETTQNGVRYASADHPNASLRPYLEVVYYPRMGERRGYVLERQKLSDRISLGVNVASGNLKVSQTDFSMPGGLGPDVSFARSYNSMHPGYDMGNWTSDTGKGFTVIQAAGGAYVTVRYPGGAKAPYTRTSPGADTYTTPPGYDNKLIRVSDGGYELTDNASQTKYRFGNYTVDGRLDEIEDRNGRKVSFVYNASNELIRIEDANNDSAVTTDDVRFSSTAGEISQMTDPAGRSYAYGYTGTQLTSFTDPQNGTGFKTLYEYNGQGGKLSKITTPQGNITTVEYYATGHADEGKVKAVTRVTNTSTLSGNRTEFEYRTRRDGSGDTRVTDPIGSQSIDENDRVTTYSIDDQGRVTSTKDALNRETKRKLTTNSNVESYTAAGNGGTTPNTSFTYDQTTNNLTATSTPTTSTGGDPMTTSGAYGQSSAVNSGTPGSEYLPTEQTNEQGGITRTSYNGGGDLNGNPYGIARYKSDGSTLVSGVSMQYSTSVDGKKGQLASITDGRLPVGKTTQYGYDAKGNVTSIDPPGTGTNQLGTTSITYDQNLARVSKVSDGKGNKRLLFYDNLDRLIRIEFTGTDETLGSLEPKVEYTYDRDGNQTSEITREEGTGTVRTRSMSYDALSRVTFESLPGGASNTYTYDAIGNLRSLTDAGGKTEYTYDAANQQRAVYEPGTTRPTKFVHDKDGLRTKTQYPNGVQVDWVYDPAHRLTAITAKKNTTVLQDLAYKYRQASSPNRQTPLRYEAEDKVLSRRTRYDYDGLDRLVDADTKTNSGTDTDLGWSAAGSIAKYGYDLDGAGNITKRTMTGTGVTAFTTNLAYDEANQLCWRSPTSNAAIPGTPCATGTRQTAFDANGNETTGATTPSRTGAYHLTDQTKTFTIGGSPTSLVYLGAGQDRWIQEGSATFQHNVLGLGSRTVSGTSTYFTRDESGGLLSRRTGSARHYYLTDALGSVTGLTDANGALSERYDYEPYGGRDMAATGAAGSADVAQGQFGFAGGYRSAGGTYHFGARFYDPSAFRWTQADPVDEASDLRQGNRYVYAAGDPVGLSDPDGEWVPVAIVVARVGIQLAGRQVARQATKKAVSATSRVFSSKTARTAGEMQGRGQIAEPRGEVVKSAIRVGRDLLGL